MAIEGIEGHAAEYGIAQSRRLFELISSSLFRAGAIPGSPFVDYQFDRVIGVEFSHDLPMPSDQRFHAVAFAQQFVPIDAVEVESVTFSLLPILSATAA